MLRKTLSIIGPALAALIASSAASAETLTVSLWGGPWRDAIDTIVGKRFKEATGADLAYVTGSAVTRLNKEKLAQGADAPDVVLTTGHTGWLYMNSNMFEPLDRSKLPNMDGLPAQVMLSPGHAAIWSYVYAICYRQSLVPQGMTFTSWKQLWDPKLKGKIGLHEIDPSHIIAVSAKLSNVPIADWAKAQGMLQELKPNIKAYYSSDAMSQDQLTSGETPVSVALVSNCHLLAKNNPDVKIAIPEGGGVGSLDAIAVMKTTTKRDLAYKYINIVFDPKVQAELAVALRVSPINAKAVLPEDSKNLAGVFDSYDSFMTKTIVVDNKVRAEKLGEWRQWFTENMATK